MGRNGQSGCGPGLGLTAAKLLAWADGAQPGAQLLYHQGYYYAGESEESVQLAIESLIERVLVYPVQRRQRHGFDYLLIRSSRPTGKGADQKATSVERLHRLFAEDGRGRL